MSEEILEREMAATEQEFRRVLALAFPQWVSESSGKLLVSRDGAAMEIALAPMPPRVIALLRLPRLDVRIRFVAGSAAQRMALLARMDRAMQRGGG